MLRFIIWRMANMIVLLFLVTIIVFTIIQLPPGDYMTTLMIQMDDAGSPAQQEYIDRLRERYGLDDPVFIQYFRWTYGILSRGDFGWSMQWQRPVSELIWERLGLSVVVSLSALALTFVIAFPVGVYSAVKQYSVGDYFASIFGFIGLATPNFVLALVFMWLTYRYFGWNVGGLFSYEFVDAPWSWAKFIDFLQHLWIPMVVIGTAGTAGLIRIIRANLLDELHKPYVEAAEARGLSPRAVLKYPVRIALNPFFSTVGWLLPTIVSGQAIVSQVLDLPTAGPLLLTSLLSQDMYLAGSFLLMLSTLTVIGTLLSDLALAWADPRIRYT